MGALTVPDGHGAFHRPIACVFCVHDPTGTRRRPRDARARLSRANATLAIEPKSASGRTRNAAAQRLMGFGQTDVACDDFPLSPKCFSGNWMLCLRKLRNIAGRAGFHLTLVIPCTRANSILMQAPKMTIFETAANLELWPKILAALSLHSISGARARSQPGDYGRRRVPAFQSPGPRSKSSTATSSKFISII